ncbi:MAG: PspC domain-containing protein [Dehalococcoidia bacterium]|nr:PspC domain-containing protein [Dehalococcoidia bacterium]
MHTTTRLMRDLDNRMIAGVCAGVARRYDWDPTVVRVAFILVGVLSAGTALVAYIAAWLIMPAGTDVEAGSVPPLKEEFRDAGERAAESARIIGRAAKQAASEIADVARRPQPATGAAATVASAASEAASGAADAVRAAGEAMGEAIDQAAEVARDAVEEKRDQDPPVASA